MRTTREVVVAMREREVRGARGRRRRIRAMARRMRRRRGGGRRGWGWWVWEKDMPPRRGGTGRLVRGWSGCFLRSWGGGAWTHPYTLTRYLTLRNRTSAIRPQPHHGTMGIRLTERLRIRIRAIMRDDQSRQGAGGEHDGHDEREVQPEPGHEGEVAAADGVDGDVAVVDFEVDHVEGEGLDEAEDGFAEEGVDAEGSAVLVEKGDDAVAQDDSDKGVGALGWGTGGVVSLNGGLGG